MAEQRVDGTDFVEAHLVDQFLEDEGIISEEVYAPLPVVEADGSRDDLLDLSRITTADHAVFVHLAGTLFNRQLIPVLLLAAAPVHGIEAGVAVRRNVRKETRVHRFLVAVQLALDFGFPLIGMRLDSLLSHLLVDLQGGLVKAKFDDGKIRGRRLQIIAQAQISELEFGLVQIGEGVAEVDQHQIALVSNEGEEGRLARRMLLHGGKGLRSFLGDSGLLACRQGAPRRPAQTEHLMQDAITFGRKGYCGDFSSHVRTGLVGSGHLGLLGTDSREDLLYRDALVQFSLQDRGTAASRPSRGRRLQECSSLRWRCKRSVRRRTEGPNQTCRSLDHPEY